MATMKIFNEFTFEEIKTPKPNTEMMAKKRVEKYVSPIVTTEEKHVHESPSLESNLLAVLNAGFSVHSMNYYMNRTNWNVNDGNVEYALHDPSGKSIYTHLDDGTYKESLKILIEDNSKG